MSSFYRENWDYVDLAIVFALAVVALSIGIAFFA